MARSIQSLSPIVSLGHLLEGEVEVEQKHWDAAAAAFRKASSKRDPGPAPARLHFALSSARKTEDAARFVQSWAKDHPNDVRFLLYLAEAAAVQGDMALAESRYQQVLKLQPDDPASLNNVAWLLIKQNKPGAVAIAERAVKVAPGRSALMDTLAMALASEGQYAKAIELQKKVVAQTPEGAVFRLTLARIYLQSGDRDQARVELDALTKLDKEFAARNEVADLRKAIGSS